MLQNEKIVETKTCKHCGLSFDITDKDLEFYEKVSPVFPNPKRPVSGKETGLNGDQSPDSFFESGLKKYLIPSPTLCPDCRQQRRLSFRNERKLYKRKCDFSGKDIISIYSPDKTYKVYDQEIWWSDKWDALDYGRDFDFSKSFFEQFGELMKEVPKLSLSSISNNNCEYTNFIGYSHNCYICISGDYNKDCAYCNSLDRSNNCFDCDFIESCDGCFDSNNLYICNNCFYSNNLKNCYNCYFCDNCSGCNNCIGCYELINKEYYIYNKNVGREKFLNFIKNNLKIKEFFYFLKTQIPTKGLHNINCEKVLGDNLSNCKNCNICFDIKSSENVKYAYRGYEGRNIMDIYGLFDINIGYDSHSVGIKSYNILFSSTCWDNLSNLLYCEHCFNNCHNCFGCIGLKNKSYCILNKQYTKSEYEVLVPKIIEHMMTPPKSPSIEGESGAIVKQGEQEWGEFFPSSISPFGYNETVAQEYYPLESSELSVISQETDTFKVCKLKTGNGKLKINWSDYEAPFPKVDKIIPASKLPENIADIPDDILNWAIECEITKKPFRIIKEELAFYRKHNLPIPRRHPDQRHLDRMSLRNPRKLFARICDCQTCEENHKNIGKYKEEEFEINKRTGKKGKKIQTTYAPERPEIVYCEECYNKEIY